MESATSSARPRLRGVSHHVACYVAVVCGGVLVASSRDCRTLIATAIYASSLAGMFGVSALLHRRDWSPRAFGWLRRADHSMIFACIAGTYTAFGVLGLDSSTGSRLLILAWTAAAFGILRAMLWPHAPRAITSGLYVAVGWVMVAFFSEIRAQLEPIAFTLLLTGGAWFTVGAVVYLIKRPDPLPSVFGYHEVFHQMIILGCTCHFVAIVHMANTVRGM